MVDRHLNTTEEIRAMLPHTLLGLIPRFSATALGPKVTMDNAPADFTQEAFRMLQTNLKFLNPDCRRQTIVVSSALPNEGKSTISAHLAATLAQSGQRVLLIDADLRSPTQQHLWDLVNGTGLSHWVMDAVAAAAVVIGGAFGPGGRSQCAGRAGIAASIGRDDFWSCGESCQFEA
jgi:polysaccharide biosynthesis transport protein